MYMPPNSPFKPTLSKPWQTPRTVEEVVPSKIMAVAMTPTQRGEIAMLAKLHSDETWARSLYEHVSRLSGKDVCIEELESSFAFVFRPIEVENGMWRDPLSSLILEEEMLSSLKAWLTGVWGTVAALPGLTPGDAAHASDTFVSQTCHAIVNNVLVPMTKPGTTQGSLKQASAKVRNYVCARAVGHARLRIDTEVAGARALQRFVTALYKGEDATAVIEAQGQVLVGVLHQPPPVLADECRRRNVPLVELRMHLYPPRQQAPTSGAARQMCIVAWARSHAGGIDSACTIAINELSRQKLLPNDSSAWHGLGIWNHLDNLVWSAVETGGIGAALRLPSPVHTASAQDLVVAAVSTTERTALIDVRLIHVVDTLIQGSHLCARRVRADWLLPYVARFGSNAAVARCVAAQTASVDVDVLNAHLNPSAPPQAAPEPPKPPHADPPESDSDSDLDTASLASEATLAPRVNEPKLEALQWIHAVPEELRRDYVIISLLRHSFVSADGQDTAMSVPVAQVVEEVVALEAAGAPGMGIIRNTKSALNKSVGHVMKKVVAEMYKKMPYVDVERRAPAVWSSDRTARVRYEKPTYHRKGGRMSIVVDAPESRIALCEFLNECMTQIRSDGRRFAGWWVTSPAMKTQSKLQIRAAMSSSA